MADAGAPLGIGDLLAQVMEDVELTELIAHDQLHMRLFH